MNRPPQQQQLLKKQHAATKQKPNLEEQQKKQAEILKRREKERHQRAIAISKKEKQDRAKKKRMQIAMTVMLTIVVAFIIAPKPRLIHYQKLNVEAYSIYIPQAFTDAGYLIDSTQKAIIDEKLNLLFLCRNTQDVGECLQYEIIETKGLFITTWFWFKYHFRWEMLVGDDVNPEQASPAN